jgi:Caspase domain
MRRRDVLLGGLAWAQLAASGNAMAQGGGPSTRAAVVIGVNKTGDLPVLRAAVSGAKSIAEWLTGEGFEVKLIVDEGQPVTADAIKKTVTALVDRGTLTQLIIYFSGHGVAFASSEFWLLTGAPDDLNEAVSVVECVDQASRCAIPNVVIISDACRSIPDFDTSLLHGTVIFPKGSYVPNVQSPEVDRFYATRPGSPAFEVKLAANNYNGIYTSTFLDAFKSPRAGMVTKMNSVDVVTNRALKAFLLDAVPARLKAAGANVIQYPDSKLESADATYIGRALAEPTARLGPAAPSITIGDVINHQFSLTKVGALSSLRPIDADDLARSTAGSEFDAAQRSLVALQARQPDSFETNCGFVVSGAVIQAAWVAGDDGALIIRPGDAKEQSGLVGIPQSYQRPVTVALVFADGSGTVVAALPGFIGSVSVENGHVASVTYSPSRGSSRWNQYADAGEQIDKLRTLVTTSAKLGVFRIEGDSDNRNATARRFADQIRVLKGVDPTLGIYAAYAYADANLPDQVRSVQSYMRGDLSADLFDIALLAGQLNDRRIDGPLLSAIVPFCPMLTQGWQLLRVRDVTLSEDVQRARDNLQPALWTTFGSRGMEFIVRAVQSARRNRIQ